MAERSPSDTMTGTAGRTTVWLTFLDGLALDQLAAYRALLDDGEQIRLDRFKVEGARTEFLVGRALLRSVLSLHATDIAPAEWRFSTNAYGRPHVCHPLPAPVHFNLSHTRGLVALVTGPEERIGVDVEWIGRGAPGRDVARRYFTADEADEIEAGADDSERSERFFALWTLKEAYIKARGMGLALPLDAFVFDCSSQDIGVRFDTARIEDIGERWHLERRILGRDHRLALACPADGKPVAFAEYVPQVGDPTRVEPKRAEPFGTMIGRAAT
ncbi:4'-phosphopantetheinyl transferase [Fulvimarina manganoxydans]|uniref:4'-phosphopantetheinyl transferase n=1 Tax=Fulvimarina manganoxydans TaxID=937218 RepID=A0A1W2DM16_9HYPH|nr:4'-phosphopantetheinyl transferase superfamily protein [Fulvimarina manganoxydans]SMC98437.1 4'-phosphopantetheinyl transferase [Fulvimarina manganoxydans]